MSGRRRVIQPYLRRSMSSVNCEKPRQKTPASDANRHADVSLSVCFSNSVRRRAMTSARGMASGFAWVCDMTDSLHRHHRRRSNLGPYCAAQGRVTNVIGPRREEAECAGMLKPVELEIELFCRGMQIDPSCHTDDGRRISRTRAGLGSGLEIVIPAKPKPIWVNVPVVEKFARHSPFVLHRVFDVHFVGDARNGAEYRVEIPPEPEWYARKTSSGVEMSRIGVLQGNYLGVYVSNRCLYWAWNPSMACKFCTTGKNVGAAEESRKRVEDVVEVARAARDESH